MEWKNILYLNFVYVRVDNVSSLDSRHARQEQKIPEVFRYFMLSFPDECSDLMKFGLNCPIYQSNYEQPSICSINNDLLTSPSSKYSFLLLINT